MATLKHRRNVTERNETMFWTTTILNFEPVFGNPLAGDRMTSGLLQAHRFHEAKLLAFVVMPEHIHAITVLPRHLNGKQFIGRLKSATANWCLPLLSSEQRGRMLADPGAEGNVFWKPRPHSTPLFTEPVLRQKIEYIHNNPLRRELVARPQDYRWSSAQFYELGLIRDCMGIEDVAQAIEMWPAHSLPPLGAVAR